MGNNAENFDRVVDSFRELEPETVPVAEAGERVRAKLFGAGAHQIDRIKGCADFRALLPGYVAKSLSDARNMLVEDHVHSCPDCRRALEELRGTRSKVRPFIAPVRSAPPSRMKWAIAAAVTLTAGATAWTVYRMGPGSNEPIMALQQADGAVYHLASTGALPAGAGQDLQAGESVRTPAGSRAVLRLFDGSLVEMNERSELSVVRDWRSTRIRLDRGNIIVQAAKQKTGTLQVSSGDATVTVRGTIFSVNRGTKGTRVSVVEGAVEVAQAGRNENLKPGGQTVTDPSLAQVPVKEEVAWSKDSARYFALLGELSALERKIDQIPGPALRYSSRLTQYIPSDARVFVAVPNIGGTLGEFKRLFDDQLRESPVLREWWQSSQNVRTRADVEMAIEKVQKLATYLGDEVVVTFGPQQSVLLMAEAKKPGLSEFLMQELKDAKVQEGRDFAVKNGILVVSPEPGRLAVGLAAIDQGGSAPGSLRARIEESYRNGVAWLVCADMEQILQSDVRSNMNARVSNANWGFDNVRYLVLERRDVAGRTNNSATLSFAGERKGVASWLATAGPLKTLEFASPNAGMAVAAVVKSPRLMLEEAFRMMGGSNAKFDSNLADFERNVGVSLVNDLAGALGSEFTFAFDGPVLPTPAWKAVVEVLAPQTLENSIEKMVVAANKELAAHPEPNGVVRKVVHSTETVNGRVFYSLTTPALPVEIHYTFADGYWIAGSSRGQILNAIEARRNGVNLARSEKFRAALPYGSNPNFSAVLYHDLGGALGPIAEQLKATGYGTAEFQKGLDQVKEMKATVVGIYGESGKITASSAGSLFGMNLSMLAALQTGRLPILPEMVRQSVPEQKAPAETVH